MLYLDTARARPRPRESADRRAASVGDRHSLRRRCDTPLSLPSKQYTVSARETRARAPGGRRECQLVDFWVRGPVGAWTRGYVDPICASLWTFGHVGPVCQLVDFCVRGHGASLWTFGYVDPWVRGPGFASLWTFVYVDTVPACGLLGTWTRGYVDPVLPACGLLCTWTRFCQLVDFWARGPGCQLVDFWCQLVDLPHGIVEASWRGARCRDGATRRQERGEELHLFPSFVGYQCLSVRRIADALADARR